MCVTIKATMRCPPRGCGGWRGLPSKAISSALRFFLSVPVVMSVSFHPPWFLSTKKAHQDSPLSKEIVHVRPSLLALLCGSETMLRFVCQSCRRCWTDDRVATYYARCNVCQEEKWRVFAFTQSRARIMPQQRGTRYEHKERIMADLQSELLFEIRFER